MHVSGHRMVEWVQSYACAKLSETIWLAGGEFFTGATTFNKSLNREVQTKYFIGQYKASCKGLRVYLVERVGWSHRTGR